MDVRHLRDRVAHRLVEGAFGGVAAGDVGERDVVHQARLGGREDLEAVAEDEDDLGPQLLERVGHADHAEADRLGDSGRRVARHQHVDPAVDREAVLLDLVDGVAELVREVHAGDDELELERRVGAQVVQHPVQQAVFGAAAGDDADAASHRSAGQLGAARHVDDARFHLLGDIELGARAGGVHRQAVHQRPERPRHVAGVVERAEQRVALAGVLRRRGRSR